MCLVGRVCIRETNFGYIIQSGNEWAADPRRTRVLQTVVFVLIVMAGAVWAVPAHIMPHMAKAVMSAAFLLGGGVLNWVITKVQGGLELHVDTTRREIRAAVVNYAGKCRVRYSARFGEVTQIVLSKPKNEGTFQRLILRLSGEEAAIPIAVGPEKTLRAVHNRFIRDLAPIEERLASVLGAKSTDLRMRRRAFPVLGPQEIAA